MVRLSLMVSKRNWHGILFEKQIGKGWDSTNSCSYKGSARCIRYHVRMECHRMYSLNSSEMGLNRKWHVVLVWDFLWRDDYKSCNVIFWMIISFMLKNTPTVLFYNIYREQFKWDSIIWSCGGKFEMMSWHGGLWLKFLLVLK